MQVHVNTDNHIHGREEIVALVETSVEGAVGRFRDRITRVEAHLSDTNSHKTKGGDIRCVLEARLAGHQPIAVTHLASPVELAVGGEHARSAQSAIIVLGACPTLVPTHSSAGSDSCMSEAAIVMSEEAA